MGALISIVAVAMGAMLHARRERRNWRRDQRMRASVDFITTTRYLINHYRWVGEHKMDQTERSARRNLMQSARSSIHLLCSPAVVDLAEELVERLYATSPTQDREEVAVTDHLFKQLVSRLRNELV